MANMGYCRFQNTVLAVDDCYDAMSENLSADEQAARLSLIEQAVQIALEYGQVIGRPVFEK